MRAPVRPGVEAVLEKVIGAAKAENQRKRPPFLEELKRAMLEALLAGLPTPRVLKEADGEFDAKKVGVALLPPFGAVLQQEKLRAKEPPLELERAQEKVVAGLPKVVGPEFRNDYPRRRPSPLL